MNAEFNWWLLIVGLVVGAGLVWLVIADWSRREEDLAAEERSTESSWIAEAMRERGAPIDPGAAEEVLTLHRAYLRQTGALADLPEPGADVADERAGADDLAAEPDVAWPTGSDWSTDEDAGDPDAHDATGAPMALTDPTSREDLPSDPRPADRRSVRMSGLSPRGGPIDSEADPPA